MKLGCMNLLYETKMVVMVLLSVFNMFNVNTEELNLYCFFKRLRFVIGTASLCLWLLN